MANFFNTALEKLRTFRLDESNFSQEETMYQRLSTSKQRQLKPKEKTHVTTYGSYDHRIPLAFFVARVFDSLSEYFTEYRRKDSLKDKEIVLKEFNDTLEKSFSLVEDFFEVFEFFEFYVSSSRVHDSGDLDQKEKSLERFKDAAESLRETYEASEILSAKITAIVGKIAEGT